jgi:hypothetical protein
VNAGVPGIPDQDDIQASQGLAVLALIQQVQSPVGGDAGCLDRVRLKSFLKVLLGVVEALRGAKESGALDENLSTVSWLGLVAQGLVIVLQGPGKILAVEVRHALSGSKTKPCSIGGKQPDRPVLPLNRCRRPSIA